MFRTIVHPTDFDEPSKEAFRVARSLAQALGVWRLAEGGAHPLQEGPVVVGVDPPVR